MHRHDPFGLMHECPECPPCNSFNCNDPGVECVNSGKCSQYTGKCSCPPGFGGDSCIEPLCGSLVGDTERPPRGNATSCTCDDGWLGINCNVCKDDSVCGPLVRDSFDPSLPVELNDPVCFKEGATIKESHQMCDVTNQKILDLLPNTPPHVTFSCNKKDASCNFQFWIGERESFHCSLDECSETYTPGKDTNTTEIACPKLSCECIPDRMLCGEAGSVDISDFLTSEIRGPATLVSKTGSESRFEEPNMNALISSIFGDRYITLKCTAGECVRRVEVPGGVEIPRGSSFDVLLFSLIAVVVLGIASLFGLRKGTSIRLEDDVEESLTNESAKTRLVFDNVSYTVPTTKQAILSDVSGSAAPGEILAIMGGSGAGKSSLIDILAGKQKIGSVTGDILVASDAAHPSLGFVDQDDLLIPELTVYETVSYAARLRLPRQLHPHVHEKVVATLHQLGLLPIKDRRIGSVARRALSGGEKRRVSIACELVTTPSVLFLDEPTSGLDAYNASAVMHCLVDLAHAHNRTIIVTIHQPRSDIVAQFDRLLLLSSGRVAFQGSLSELHAFLASIDKPCPKGYNVADFILDLDMSDKGEGDLPEQHRAWRGSSGIQSLPPTQDELVPLEKHVTPMLDPLAQLAILNERSLKILHRNTMLLLAHYAVAAVSAAACCLLFGRLSTDIPGFQNRMGFFFFILALFGFSGLSLLSTMAAKKLMFSRQRAKGYFSTGPFYVSFLLTDFVPLRLGPPCLLALLVYVPLNLVPTVGAFFRFLIILVAFNATTSSLMVFLSIVFDDIGVANLVASLLLLLNVLLAGLLINRDKLVFPVSALVYLSYFHAAFEGLLVNELRYLQLTDRRFGVDISIPAATILSVFGFRVHHLWVPDTLYLVVLSFALPVLTYLVMRTQLHERR